MIFEGIDIVRGTTKAITFTVYDSKGAEYKLKTGEKLIFGVKEDETKADYIIKKVITENDYDSGGYLIKILPKDTEKLEFKKYWFDIGLQISSSYYMVYECSPFNVKRNITSREA